MALQEYKSLFKNGQKVGGIYQNGNLVWPAKMETGSEYILTNGKHIETGLFTSGTFDASLIDIEMNFNTSNWTSTSEKRAVFFGFSNNSEAWWTSDNFGSMLVYLEGAYKVNAYINGYYDALLTAPISLDTEYVLKYTGNNLTFELAGVSAPYGSTTTTLSARELWLGGINLIDDDPTAHPSFNLGRTKIWYNNVLIGDFVPNSETSMINNVTGVTHNLVPNV